MGLLKAGVGAVGGVLADQWREYFYCEALDADTLVAKGEKRTGRRSSNTKGRAMSYRTVRLWRWPTASA